MHVVKWWEQYDHMGKKHPQPNKLLVNKIVFTLTNGKEVTMTYNKEVTNLTKWLPKKMKIEFQKKDGEIFYKTWNISNKRKNRKRGNK